VQTIISSRVTERVSHAIFIDSYRRLINKFQREYRGGDEKRKNVPKF